MLFHVIYLYLQNIRKQKPHKLFNKYFCVIFYSKLGCATEWASRKMFVQIQTWKLSFHVTDCRIKFYYCSTLWIAWQKFATVDFFWAFTNYHKLFYESLGRHKSIAGMIKTTSRHFNLPNWFVISVKIADSTNLSLSSVSCSFISTN